MRFLARHFFAHIADSESGLPAPCGLITAVGSSPVLNFEEEEQGRAGSRVISGGWMRALSVYLLVSVSLSLVDCRWGGVFDSSSTLHSSSVPRAGNATHFPGSAFLYVP